MERASHGKYTPWKVHPMESTPHGKYISEVEVNRLRFHNRDEELAKFLEIPKSDKAELINLYGIRRVGKTKLLKEFISKSQDMKIFYKQLTKINSKESLKIIQDDLKSKFKDEPIFQYATFENWEDLFSAVFSVKDLIVCLDEFCYLVEVDKSVPSILQKVWDSNSENSTTKLVLCGSYVSVMENLINDELGGRFTYKLDLKPFDFVKTRLFMNSLEIKEQVRLYLIFGGVPYYYALIEEVIGLPLNEILVSKVFNQFSILRTQPVTLKTHTLKPYQYFSILHAINKGKKTLGEIKNSTGITSRSGIQRMLETLIGLRVIKRVSPFLTKTPTEYKIIDPFTRFWFRFLNETILDPEIYVNNQVMPDLDFFLSKPGFEDFCKEVIQILSNERKLTDSFKDVHSFKDQYEVMEKKEGLEIDIISLGNETLILGECKWTNDSPTLSEIRKFFKKCDLFFDLVNLKYKDFTQRKWKKILYVFFSREEPKISPPFDEDKEIFLISLNTIKHWFALPHNPDRKLF